MITYTFQKVTYNGIQGYIATQRINGLFNGKQFGKTKTQAIKQFEGE